MTRILSLLLLAFLPSLAWAQDVVPVACCGAQEVAQDDAKPKVRTFNVGGRTYYTGRIAPSDDVLKARHASMFARHDHRMRALPNATPEAFDCRDGGYMPEIGDQGPCGYCHGYSGADACSLVLMKSGFLKIDNKLANQFGLDCHPFGGCNGGDEYDTINYIMKNGFPLTSDYYPYVARSQGCRAVKNNGKLFKIADMGFCTPAQQQGVASTQDMKNAIYQYGPISVAFDAAGCDSYNGGVMRGRGNNVDHAVLCCGWRTNKTTGKTEFLGRNQWGTNWGGLGGYFWIEEGSYSWGTEAIWVNVQELPPPPPPLAIPVITSPLTLSAVVNQPINYHTTATNSPTSFSGTITPLAGTALTIDATTGVLAGTVSKAGSYVVKLSATNASGTGTATLALTVTDKPVPPPIGGATITLSNDLKAGTYEVHPAGTKARLDAWEAWLKSMPLPPVGDKLTPAPKPKESSRITEQEAIRIIMARIDAFEMRLDALRETRMAGK